MFLYIENIDPSIYRYRVIINGVDSRCWYSEPFDTFEAAASKVEALYKLFPVLGVTVNCNWDLRA